MGGQVFNTFRISTDANLRNPIMVNQLYNKKMFGADLLAKLQQEACPMDGIAEWAINIYNKNLDRLEDDVSDIILGVGIANLNADFVVNSQQLKSLATNLMRGK